METKLLEDLGLSNIESKVYLSLIEIGLSTASKIAEKSGIHRRTVYDALETLIEKGLVSFVVESNRKYYQAEDPKRFLDILEDKKSNFEKILPELLEKKGSNKDNQEVTVFRGKKGLKNAMELMFISKETIHSFGSSGKFKEIMGEIYYDQWMDKLIKSQIKLHILISEKLKGENFPNNIKTKFIKEPFVLPSSITIWEDKTLILIFAPQIISILIKSKEAAESYLKYFDLLWKLAKP